MYISQITLHCPVIHVFYMDLTLQLKLGHYVINFNFLKQFVDRVDRN